MKVHSVHSRELPAAADEVGALLDGLGSQGARLWPSDRWPTTPLELDGPLEVGTLSRQGVFRLTQIRQVVDEYRPGRRIAFRGSRMRSSSPSPAAAESWPKAPKQSDVSTKEVHE